MRYAEIRKFDATNWDGINTTIFFTGCSFGCPGCFNKDIQDFRTGDQLTREMVDEFIDHANSPHVTGVCILGGEPFQQNLEELYSFIYRVRTEVNKPIHVWTGFEYEFLTSLGKTKNILYLIDTLVDGLFIEELKDLNLKYRGSSNQRVIDVQESLRLNKMIKIRD